MKRVWVRFMAMVCVLAGLSVGPAEAFYTATDSANLDVMGATRFAYTQDGMRYVKQDFRLTNTGEETLTQVGVLWQFLYAGPGAFSYQNEEHRWERSLSSNGASQTLWLDGLTYDPLENPEGQNDYFSLDRANTDASLEYRLSDREICKLAETDEVPVFWLGDISAGGSALFSVYAGQGLYQEGQSLEGWSFSPVFQYVTEAAPVPLPATIWLMAGGLASVQVLRRRWKTSKPGTDGNIR